MQLEDLSDEEYQALVDEFFVTTNSKGWEFFIAQIQEWLDQSNDIDDVKSMEDLYIRKGERKAFMEVIHLEDMLEQNRDDSA